MQAAHNTTLHPTHETPESERTQKEGEAEENVCTELRMYTNPAQQRSAHGNVCADSCFVNFAIQDVLMQLALGTSLKSSRSPLAMLPHEVIHIHIARQVRALYMQNLSDRGLLTPVQAPAPAPEERAPPHPRTVSRKEPPKLQQKTRVKARSVFGGMQGFKRSALKFEDFGKGAKWDVSDLFHSLAVRGVKNKTSRQL